MEFLTILLVSIIILLILSTHRHVNYFKKHNVPYSRSIPFLGAFTDVLIGKTSFYDITASLYNDPKLKDQPFFGIFVFHKPALFIKDPELIKNILIKDFSSFVNHHLASDVHDQLGYYNVFAMKDPYWKIIRKRISPFFSSGKMKLMFPIIEKIGDDLINFIDAKLVNNSMEVDSKDLATYFTTDVVASTAFSVEASSMKDPNSEFFLNAKRIFTSNTKRLFELITFFLLPEVTKLIDFHFFTKTVSEFIVRTMDLVVGELQ
jgi:cytochrome P450 family 6